MSHLPAVGNYYTPEMFEAAGNGVADDYAPLRDAESAAFASGSMIILTPGRNYAIGTPWGCRVPIMGMGATITALAGVSTGTVIANNVSSSYGDALVWDNFVVVGSGTGGGKSQGIEINNITKPSTFSRLTISNSCDFGFLLQTSAHVLLDNLWVKQVYRNGALDVSADGVQIDAACSDVTLQKSTIYDFQRDGVKVSAITGGVNSQRIRILNNDISYAHGFDNGPNTEENCGIYVEEGLDVEIAGNHVYNIAGRDGQTTASISSLFGIFASGTYVNAQQVLSSAMCHDNLVEMGTPQAVTGCADNGAGLVRLTLGSTANMSTNQYMVVQGIKGATGANGTSKITVINATHVDLQGSSFGGAYTASTGYAVVPLGVAFVGQAGSGASTLTLNSATLKLHHNEARYCQVAGFFGEGFSDIDIDDFTVTASVTPVAGEAGLLFFYPTAGSWPTGLPYAPSISMRHVKVNANCTITTASAVQADIVFDQGFGWQTLEMIDCGEVDRPLSIMQSNAPIITTPGGAVALIPEMRMTDCQIALPAFASSRFAFAGTVIRLKGNSFFGGGSGGSFALQSAATAYQVVSDSNVWSNCTLNPTNSNSNSTLVATFANDTFEALTSFASISWRGKCQILLTGGAVKNWSAATGTFFPGNVATVTTGSLYCTTGALVSNAANTGATLYATGGGNAMLAYSFGCMSNLVALGTTDVGSVTNSAF